MWKPTPSLWQCVNAVAIPPSLFLQALCGGTSVPACLSLGTCLRSVTRRMGISWWMEVISTTFPVGVWIGWEGVTENTSCHTVCRTLPSWLFSRKKKQGQTLQTPLISWWLPGVIVLSFLGVCFTKALLRLFFVMNCFLIFLFQKYNSNLVLTERRAEIKLHVYSPSLCFFSKVSLE